MKENIDKDNIQSPEYNKKKWKFVLHKVVLSRVVPLMMVLITFNEVFYKVYEKSHNVFFILLVIKACLGISIGVVSGLYEWNFNEKLIKGQFKHINEIKKEYVKIFGIIGWGLIIGVCYIRYPLGSVFSIITDVIVWFALGYILGNFTWKNAQVKYEKFIQE
jgi:hypothetical protein